MLAGYQILEADLERDRDAILGVWARNLPTQTPAGHRSKYDWYYRTGPAGPGRCWLLVNEADGRVVGTSGLGVRRARVGGRPGRVGIASDFAVDAAHRSLFPAMALTRAILPAAPDFVDFIYGTPNKNAIGILRRLKYTSPAELRRCVKVLQVEKYLRAYANIPGPVRTAGAAVVDLALRAVSTETWRRPKGRDVKPVTNFDARFDDLWERVGGTLHTACERTAAFLQWRYRDCPLRSYEAVALTSRGDGRLLGYAVCYRAEGDQVAVVDWVADPSADRAADDLLAGLVSWCRAQGAASVSFEFLGSHPLQPSLERFGFRPRDQQLTVLVAPTASGEPPEAVNDWYFMLGDEDIN